MPDTDGGHRQHNGPSIGEGPSAGAPFSVAKVPGSGSGVPASDAAGDEAGPRDQAAVHSFIEGFTSLLTQAGFPRTPARIFVALLTSDSSKFTAAELAELLRTSPASVSGGVRYLIQVGLVTAEGEPGSRRQHYRMPTDVWDEIVRLRNRQFARWVTELRGGVSALGADTPAGSRLAQTVRYFDFLATEMTDLLTRWQDLDSRGTHAAEGTPAVEGTARDNPPKPTAGDPPKPAADGPAERRTGDLRRAAQALPESAGSHLDR